MRILTALLCLVLFSTGVMAQSNNVVTAYNHLKYYLQDKNPEEISNAMKYIDLAAEHEKTMGQEKTWRYRGMIYKEIGVSTDPAVAGLHKSALQEAIRSYNRANELDEKGQYQRENDREIKILGQVLINKGVDEFKKKNYDRALEMFEASIAISEKAQVVDTLAWYNAALASEKAGQHQKAADYYGRCVKANYGGASTYLFLSQAYTNLNDTVMAFKAVQDGRKAHPSDKNLIVEELSYYLRSGKNNEALQNLKLAIQADPQNHILHFAMGTIYDKLAFDPATPAVEVEKNIRAAEESYKKALEIKPDYFDVLFNLGALHVNYGVKLMENAQTIKDNAKYMAEAAKADTEYKVAMPYLEKAHELNPADRNTMITLKQLYARMQLQDKFKAMDEKLKN